MLFDLFNDPYGARGTFSPASPFFQGVFGRLFPQLPAWSGSRSEVTARARKFFDDPKPQDDLGTLNPRLPAGYAIFGQFVAHDLSFDPASLNARLGDPDRIRNFRTPRLDLDMVYGSDPDRSPWLFKHSKGRNTYRFLIGGRRKKTLAAEDLPRTPSGQAIIPDARNDSHQILAQLHLAFLKLHNRVMGELSGRRQGPSSRERFDEARRFVVWHYQDAVLHDLLPRLVAGGEESVKRSLRRRREGRPTLFRWRNQPFIPVEFSVAVYRAGHATIRQKYELNDRSGSLVLFDNDPAKDLSSGRALGADRVVAWERLVPIRRGDGARLQDSRKFRPWMAHAFRKLPGPPPASLAERDLLRAWYLGIPSGQDVARALGLEPIAGDEPLWEYVLREAMGRTNRRSPVGASLGPVGSRIMTEVLVGLAAGDPGSFLNVDPRWRPEIRRRRGDSRLGALLDHAGMPMTDEETIRR